MPMFGVGSPGRLPVSNLNAAASTRRSAIGRPARPEIRYTVIDHVSAAGRQRNNRLPPLDDVRDLVYACEDEGTREDFAEVLGWTPTWSSTERLADKLVLALRGSAVVVIAYEDGDGDGDGAGYRGGFSDSLLGRMGLSVLGGGAGGAPRGKVVGMGRAVTDGSLVATVHDVIVRPGYRRQGVGRRILQLLCRYLDTNMDVIDVGTTCWREETKEFLGKAGFGDDDEQSVAMRLVVRNGDELHRFGNGK